MRWAVFALVVCGCHDGTDDITGPYSGEIHRYVIDQFTIPLSSKEALRLGGDLDRDGQVDNRGGLAISLLASYDNITPNSADMVAAGTLDSVVEIQTDDLMVDPAAGVIYFGAPGEPAIEMGASISGGRVTTNRSATARVPGEAILHLPVFRDADPVVIPIVALELDLPSTAGGVALVHGCLPAARTRDAVFSGMLQMLAADPQSHLLLSRAFDSDRDGAISRSEFDTNSLIAALVVGDLDRNGESCLSFGFAVHLTPCAMGRCAGPIDDQCHDRISDGDETDVDCGGGCTPCAGGQRCSIAADCQSNACDGELCRPPSCTDRLLNGFESDIDCGAICATKCAQGQACIHQDDCADGLRCDAPLASVGVCKP